MFRFLKFFIHEWMHYPSYNEYYKDMKEKHPKLMAMIENSDCCIIAADSSKFNRTAFTKISNLDIADYIVTNSIFEQDIIEKFRNLGVEIITA